MDGAPIAGLYLVQCDVSLDPSPGATVVDIVIRERVEGEDNAAA